jgi:DNA modification methylase
MPTAKPRATAGLQIRRIALSSLSLDPANARSHSSANLDAVRASLSRFGQAEPLVVQSGTLRIIGGHARLQAMQALGWKECDIVELDVTNLDATALGIALNRTAELAEWDERVLSELLKTLQVEDALEGVGFSNAEIEDLLAKIDTGESHLTEDPGPGEPPVNPVSRPGDLWVLGDHRLLCGDSKDPESFARAMGGEKASLLSTDPPYCVDYTGNNRPVHKGKRSGKDWSHVYREIDISDLGEFLDGFLTAALPHIQEDAPIYLWHAHVQQPVVAATFERHGILFHQVLVWVKPCAVFGHSYYQWQHEPCAFGWKKGHKPKHGQGQLSSVWEADWEGKARVVGNEHPTQKPTRLFEIPMEQHTKGRDLVLEPFSGSGSQLIAAEKVSRRCVAIEISPAFVDVAISRWERATKKQATLDGKNFEEVASERGVR